MWSICIWPVSFEFCRRTETRPWVSLLIKANGTPNQGPNARGRRSFDHPLVRQLTTTTLYKTAPEQPPRRNLTFARKHPPSLTPSICVNIHAFVNVNGKPHTRFSRVTMHHPQDSWCLLISGLWSVTVAHVTLHLTHRITALESC